MLGKSQLPRGHPATHTQAGGDEGAEQGHCRRASYSPGRRPLAGRAPSPPRLPGPSRVLLRLHMRAPGESALLKAAAPGSLPRSDISPSQRLRRCERARRSTTQGSVPRRTTREARHLPAHTCTTQKEVCDPVLFLLALGSRAPGRGTDRAGRHRAAAFPAGGGTRARPEL